MIEIKNISKAFSGVDVLKDISATFESGKINMIIGASGSGKSVLIKCIVGLIEPDKGSAFFEGVDFTKMGDKARLDIRKKLGFLFQYSALFDSLTVEENVMCPLRMFTDMKRKEMVERVNFCLNRLQIDGKNHLFTSE